MKQQVTASSTEAGRFLRIAMWCALAAIASFLAQILLPSAVSFLFAAFLLLGGMSLVTLALAILSFVRTRFLKRDTEVVVLNTPAEQRSQARKLGIFVGVGCYFLAIMQFVSPGPPSSGRWSWLTSAVYEVLGNPGLALLWLCTGTFLIIAVSRR